MSGERLVSIRSLWSPRTTDGAVGAFRAGWAVPLGGGVTWPVADVSATHSIFVVPTTIPGGTQPQYAYARVRDSDGLFEAGFGYLTPNLFGEKTGDLRLNPDEGFFVGTCGGTATARILMPAAGTSIALEANTIIVTGQEWTVDILGTKIDGWVALTVWKGTLTHPTATSTYLSVGDSLGAGTTLTITQLSGLKCTTGSGTLKLYKNGVEAASEAFTTSTGGTGDNRTVTVTIAAGDEVYAETTGTFTGFRGAVKGTKY